MFPGPGRQREVDAFGTLILASLHLPDDAIRWLGLALLVLVGLGLLVPPLGHLIERPFNRFPQRVPGAGHNGFVLGAALGAVFVPCAGPVLAAITVAGATGHIGLRTIGLAVGFAVGTAIPLLAFALAGRGVSQRLGAFRRHQGAFRAVSGALMIILAVALTFNLSGIIQRDVPNYTQAAGNSLEKGAAAAQGDGGGVSLKDCQTGGGSALEQCGPAPAFSGIQQWLNTPGGKPVSMASLKGKVVFVDFWAYSCINCQRELPHVEAWYRNYAAGGLEVVGVHTPEYAFEHVPSNVAAGVRRLALTFPVALDNSYDTWNAYDGAGSYTSGQHQFTPPGTLAPNSFALSGTWTIGQQSITAGSHAQVTLAYHASYVYLDVGGNGTLTVITNGTNKTIRVSGAPDIYTVATRQPAQDGTVTIRLSPGLAAYSFTFG